eukprot:CAMPEP_0115855976 /NCGR_PEP_ID=MMETSP0287-20121206/14816_1 /TAXON_ID=412157 /ORGANISM="Chrysochromulina rotalis, Strain UIO044" /LENGTH=50 /DNA_ID=CAMNT_0003310139 /DNA_START=730 /DNA_END=882 /DNA_ORIENTATION=-
MEFACGYVRLEHLDEWSAFTNGLGTWHASWHSNAVILLADTVDDQCVGIE